MRPASRVLSIAVAVSVGLAACGDHRTASRAGGDDTERGTPGVASPPPAAMPTAGEQPNVAGDVDVTRRIREEIASDATLSTSAHNVTIVSENGHVTLRGPVESAEEKAKIVAIAERAVGGRVEDQLEVASD